MSNPLGDLISRIESLESALLELDKRTEGTRTADHKGLSVVAGEGLRGGGTIDKSRGLALCFSELEEGVMRAGHAWLAFYHDQEGVHFKVEFQKFVDTLVASCGIPELLSNVLHLHKEFETLRSDFSRLRLYDLLPEKAAEVGMREVSAKSIEEWIQGVDERIVSKLAETKKVVSDRVDNLEERERVVKRREVTCEALEDEIRTKFKKLEDDWRELREAAAKVAKREAVVSRVEELEKALRQRIESIQTLLSK